MLSIWDALYTQHLGCPRAPPPRPPSWRSFSRVNARPQAPAKVGLCYWASDIVLWLKHLAFVSLWSSSASPASPQLAFLAKTARFAGTSSPAPSGRSRYAMLYCTVLYYTILYYNIIHLNKQVGRRNTCCQNLKDEPSGVSGTQGETPRSDPGLKGTLLDDRMKRGVRSTVLVLYTRCYILLLHTTMYLYYTLPCRNILYNNISYYNIPQHTSTYLNAPQPTSTHFKHASCLLLYLNVPRTCRKIPLTNPPKHLL